MPEREASLTPNERDARLVLDSVRLRLERARRGPGGEAADTGEAGWGTVLAAVGGLAGVAALTKGRGVVRAFRALPPPTQAEIMQMVAGALGAGTLATAYALRNPRLPGLERR